MPIVSVSLNDEILSELQDIQSEMGFAGRSDVIRAGIRNLRMEERQNASLSGKIRAVLLVVHGDEFDNVVSGLKHSFEDLITTHLHSRIEGNKCMELFVIYGDAEVVARIAMEFRANKKMDTVKLVKM